MLARHTMRNLLALALVSLAMLSVHAGEPGTASCCTKPADGAAKSCCAPGGAAAATSAQADPHAGHGGSGAQGPRGGGMRGGMGGPGAVMPDAMRLLHNYASLERKVEEIPNGVKTTSTTNDPAVLELLRRHPREMYSYYEKGGVVRPFDPMFSELSRVADKVTMEFKNVENGIEVVATSDDPEVVKLIRAHAYKVSEFVKRGMEALHEGAPLPDDYHPAE